jgi:hypothetical protein
MDEEITKTSLLRTGKDQNRAGIEFLRSQHGGQGIKIGIDMSGDHVHNQTAYGMGLIADRFL